MIQVYISHVYYTASRLLGVALKMSSTLEYQTSSVGGLGGNDVDVPENHLSSFARAHNYLPLEFVTFRYTQLYHRTDRAFIHVWATRESGTFPF